MKLLNVLAFSVAVSLSTAVSAEQVSFSFTGNMTEISPELSGYYSMTDAINGVITVDTDVPALGMAYGNVFLDSISMTASIGGDQIIANDGYMFTYPTNFSEIGGGPSSLGTLTQTSAIPMNLWDWGYVISNRTTNNLQSTPFDILRSGIALSTMSVQYKTDDQAYPYLAWNIDHLTQLPLAAAVPEPATYLMLLTGLGFAGFMARRKRQA